MRKVSTLLAGEESAHGLLLSNLDWSARPGNPQKFGRGKMEGNIAPRLLDFLCSAVTEFAGCTLFPNAVPRCWPSDIHSITMKYEYTVSCLTKSQ